MGKNIFFNWLNDNVYYSAEYITEKGVVIGFVVRLCACINGVWFNIIRYDTAHGTPHIDVLNIKGKTKDKIWMPHLPPGKALTFAINDIKINYKTYIRRFENA